MLDGATKPFSLMGSLRVPSQEGWGLVPSKAVIQQAPRTQMVVTAMCQ